MVTKMERFLGKEDLRHPVGLIRCLVSEMVATMLLIIIGCGPALGLSQVMFINTTLSTLVMYLGFGIATMGAVYYTSHISGGNDKFSIKKRGTSQSNIRFSPHQSCCLSRSPSWWSDLPHQV